ncbi:MAG: trypsin-like peptidase domain-containing protein [Planctomycetota bacterium]
MRSLLVLTALLALVTPAFADVDLDKLRASVIQIDVTTQGEDYWAPWNPPAPYGSGGSGFYIGDRRLMTNAHVVTEAKVIRVKRPDRPKKYEARIIHIAHDSDLAMITVDDETFFEGMVPLEFGGIPKLKSTVTAVGYPMGGQKLSITSGVVSRIELHGYVHTGADRHLAIQVDAAINPGNSGGPVMQDNQVVGVAFQTQFFAQNIGYMIPVTVIRHFLKDIEDGNYDGYPMLGIITGGLENDTLREWLKVPEGETGVVILKALPNSSLDGKVEKHDVLHAIDEYKIENDGTVKFDGEYLQLAFIVQEKHVGEKMTLKLRRDGKPMELEVELKKWDIRMPEGTAYGEKPEYLVLGGYVFVPLTKNFADRSGWRSRLTYLISEIYNTLWEEYEGMEQLVVLSRVLRHDSNRYRTYGNAIVRTVNGKRPKDFKEFVTMLEGADRAVIEFEGVNPQPLILDKKKIQEVQQAILDQYGIKVDRHVKEGK